MVSIFGDSYGPRAVGLPRQFAGADTTHTTHSISGRIARAANGPVPIPNANDPLDGAFTLTLQIGSSCSAIPDAEKTRVYDASIGQIPNRTELGHVVTLSGSRFLTGSYAPPGCTGNWMQSVSRIRRHRPGVVQPARRRRLAWRAHRRADVVGRVARDRRSCGRAVQQRFVDRGRWHRERVVLPDLIRRSVSLFTIHILSVNGPASELSSKMRALSARRESCRQRRAGTTTPGSH